LHSRAPIGARRAFLNLPIFFDTRRLGSDDFRIEPPALSARLSLNPFAEKPKSAERILPGRVTFPPSFWRGGAGFAQSLMR